MEHIEQCPIQPVNRICKRRHPLHPLQYNTESNTCGLSFRERKKWKYVPSTQSFSLLTGLRTLFSKKCLLIGWCYLHLWWYSFIWYLSFASKWIILFQMIIALFYFCDWCDLTNRFLQMHLSLEMISTLEPDLLHRVEFNLNYCKCCFGNGQLHKIVNHQTIIIFPSIQKSCLKLNCGLWLTIAAI